MGYKGFRRFAIGINVFIWVATIIFVVVWLRICNVVVDKVQDKDAPLMESIGEMFKDAQEGFDKGYNSDKTEDADSSVIDSINIEKIEFEDEEDDW